VWLQQKEGVAGACSGRREWQVLGLPLFWGGGRAAAGGVGRDCSCRRGEQGVAAAGVVVSVSRRGSVSCAAGGGRGGAVAACDMLLLFAGFAACVLVLLEQDWAKG
jgi:hypothetical protein